MNLLEFKEEQDLSYTDLALLLGMSRARTHRIATTQSHCIRAFEVEKITKATDGKVTILDLGGEPC